MKTKLMLFAAIAALMLAGCSKERGGETPNPPEPTPPPAKPEYDIYMAGAVWDGKTDVPCYWKNGQQHELAVPDGTEHYPREIAISEGSLYIVGEGSRTATGYWKDGVWHKNAVPAEARSCRAHTIAVADGSVYMAGYYRKVDNTTAAGYWKDGVWQPFESIPGSIGEEARSIAVSEGSVYVAGERDGNIFGYWADGVWKTLPGLEGTNNGYCMSIACSGNSVYATGYCYNTDADIWQACTWENGVVRKLAVPEGVKYYYGFKIVVADGKVYVVGNYSKEDGKNAACYWKDGVFHALEAPGELVGTDSIGLSVCDGAVYVSGYYESAPGTYASYYWKDGERFEISASAGIDPSVSSIAVVKRN